MPDKPTYEDLERRLGKLEEAVSFYKESLKEFSRIKNLLDSIRKAQSLFISHKDNKQIFEILLSLLVSMTESEFGFLDEVLYKADGRPYKLNLAMSNIAWDNESEALYSQLRARDLEFHNLNNLSGLPVLFRKIVIANDAEHDPRSGGLPEGHPPIFSFMGLPVFSGQNIVGVVGVANRPGGYNEQIAQFLEPYVNTCASIIEAIRSRERELKAVEDLRINKVSIEKEHKLLQEVMNGAKNIHLVYLDREFNFVRVNEAYAKTCGYLPEEMIGKNHFVLYPNPENEAIFTRVCDTGEPFEVRDKPFTFPDQPERGVTYWDWSLVPIKEPEGGVRGLVFSLVETTDRKRAEEAKDRLEAGLRHAQKLKAIGTLANGIAHEFNNLLAVIMGYSEMIQDEAEDRDDILADISEIIKATERGRDLVRRIMAYSRKTETPIKPLSLNNEIRSALDMLNRLLSRNISIETQLAPDLKRVNMAASHLKQVLMHLVTNASHAMPTGGKLTIKTESTSVEQLVCPSCGEVFSGDYVLLSVNDTGHGIARKMVQRVFEPFFTTKDVGSGTGLGLSVVQGLILSYEWHIICKSELGKGTTFSIFLPAIQNEKLTSAVVGTSLPAGIDGTETILLVDDEETLRNLAQRYFSEKGYRVCLAANGEEALEIYQQQQRNIDLVVLDLGMAGMGGENALKEILAINPQAKVVIASGYSNDGPGRKALCTGAAAFVGKPFKKGELLATVRRVLNGGA